MPSLLTSLDPATGDVVGEVPITDAADVAGMVVRARAAQPSWRALGLAGRQALLARGLAALAEDHERIGALLCREMGKPLSDAVAEVRSCGHASQLDEIATALAPEVIQDERTHTVLHRDPLGVVAVITPWNFPVMMPHILALPALMAGNTVVLKPSEETPLVAQAWADALSVALPPYVFAVLHGDEEQGRALVQADVNLIAFTGSRAAGAQIQTAAGPQLKRVLLELGGKDPMVVLADADVEEAAQFAVRNSFRNAGQVCVSTERIYVATPIAAQFEERVVALAGGLVVGSGLRSDTDVGPMINAHQKAHVVDQVQRAVKRGAQLRLSGEDRGGNWLAPTVLTGVDHSMSIMRDETFGPVACIMRFTDVEEAVALANDTPYGLGAVVFGAPEPAEVVARRLDAGMVGVNRSVGGASGSPWVGAKQSGVGFHSGPEGHRQFTQARIVSRPLAR